MKYGLKTIQDLRIKLELDVLVVIFSVISLSLFGQVSPTGFGRIQLGMDIREFTSNRIDIEIKVDNISAFHLDSLVVNDVLTLHDISLSFYNDKLYKIDIGEDLSDILKLKYGSYIIYFDKVDIYGHKHCLVKYSDTNPKDRSKYYNNGFELSRIWGTSNNTVLFTNWNRTTLYNNSIMENLVLEDKVRLEKDKENKRLEEERARIEEERIRMERNNKLLEGF